ncbi:branched-chain amino acid ABC transporter permease [Bosea thiooxidans]
MSERALSSTASSTLNAGLGDKLARLLDAALLLLLLVVPWVAPSFWTYIFALSLANAIGVLSVSVVIRYAGEVSIGQNFFIAVGAYAVAILQARLGVPFPLGAAFGALLGCLMGLAFAWPSRKLSGVYLSVATLALGLCVPELLLHWTDITGGFEGMNVKPDLVAGVPGGIQQFYVALAGFAIVVIALARFRHSRYGIALLTARHHAKAAEAFGMPLASVRLLVFALSAGIAGFGGSILAFASSTVSPNSFTFWSSVYLLVGSVVCLYSTKPSAAFFGGLFITLLPQLLSDYGELVEIIYGFTLFVVIYIFNIALPHLQAAIRRKQARNGHG